MKPLVSKTINPVGYLDMINLLSHSSIVLTDSGGLQKEAFFFAKPCVTLRNETEWVELVDGGFNLAVHAGNQDVGTDDDHYIGTLQLPKWEQATRLHDLPFRAEGRAEAGAACSVSVSLGHP